MVQGREKKGRDVVLILVTPRGRMCSSGTREEALSCAREIGARALAATAEAREDTSGDASVSIRRIQCRVSRLYARRCTSVVALTSQICVDQHRRCCALDAGAQACRLEQLTRCPDLKGLSRHDEKRLLSGLLWKASPVL